MDVETLQHFDVRDVVKLNVKSLEFFGYFCPDFTTTFMKVIYYTYALLFVGSMFVLFMVSEIINMVVVFGDIEKMTEASFLLLTHLVQALKLYVFVVHNSRVRRLINSLNREEFKPKNQQQYNLLMEDVQMSRILTKIFLIMCVATCVLWGVFPLLDKDGGEETTELPLSGWFPFDTQKSPIFECVYVYLTMGAMINGLANVSMDTFLSGIIMVISGQLKLLNNSFQNLKQKCTDTSLNHIEEGLIKNIVHHKNIIQFSENMTELFTTCIMGQFVVSVIIICITMFQMSLVSVISLQFLSMALYQGCMVLEIFLWCYYGNEVIIQSEKLTQSAYSCEWVGCSRNFGTNLLFFMARSQISLKLYAGGYFALSLETFMAIVKSSWSYFAVLNRVHSDQE
ncbi:odorant receptor Or1-like [Zophobas morio]|uniref:odorant receptor Or1-like n=1 Tax=Zophobas morio TaxID=2755281 RepID=UPI003082F1E4